MGYTEVFGGNTIYPADVSFLRVNLTGNISFEWPLESAMPLYPLARIVDVFASPGGFNMTLPDATEASPGEVVLFNNLTGGSTCFVKDGGGTTIATLAAGEQWELYLVDNTTPAGIWRIFRFGASTATVQPSALAGFGLTVTGSTLSQAIPVTTFTASPRTVLATDRASALVWTGGGSAVINLPGVASVGNNFFVSVRNAGGGDVTLDPLGGELIDGATTVPLSPGEGVLIMTDGLKWYTLGHGQPAVFAFDYVVIDLTGAGATYPLTGSQLNRISYKFTGTLTTNVIVQVPSTIQQYWVNNSTTGAFTLSMATVGGTAVVIPQGSRGIYYCDGVNFLDADTATISLPVNPADGGTGQTSYTIGDMLYASGVTSLSRLAAVPVGNVLNANGTATPPVWGKLNLATSVTGVLPPANGGTGVVGAYTQNFLTKGNAAGNIVSSTIIYDDGTNIGIGTSTPGAKLDVNGAATVGGVLTVSGNRAIISAPSGNKQVLDFLQTSVVGRSFGANVAGDLVWNDGNNLSGVDRMTLTGAGNLGIGVTPPATSGRNVTISGGEGQVRLVGSRTYTVASGGNFQYALDCFSVYDNTAAAYRLVINSAGLLGLGGAANPQAQIHIKGSGELQRLETTTARNSGQNYTSFYDPTGIKGYVGYNADDTFLITNVMNYPMAFYTNNAERMRINATGELGVGTIAAAGIKLHVKGVGDMVRMETTATRGTGQSTLAFYDSVGRKGRVGYAGTGDDGIYLWNDLNAFVAFGTNAIQRAAISPAGWLGIGDSSNSPAGMIDINQSSGGTGSTPGLRVAYNSPGAAGALAGLAVYFNLSSGLAESTLVAGNTANSFMAFAIHNGTTYKEAMRVTNGADVVVGQISSSLVSKFGVYQPTAAFRCASFQMGDPNDVANVVFLHARANGAVAGIQCQFFNSATGSVGSITSTGSATAYNTSCDVRLKENITPAPPTGPLIDAINIVKFDWKTGGHVDYGVIAQDLNTVYPDAVAPGAGKFEFNGKPREELPDGEEEFRPWMVDYSKLVPLLIKEIQDLRSRLTAAGL